MKESGNCGRNKTSVSLGSLAADDESSKAIGAQLVNADRRAASANRIELEQKMSSKMRFERTIFALDFALNP